MLRLWVEPLFLSFRMGPLQRRFNLVCFHNTDQERIAIDKRLIIFFISSFFYFFDLFRLFKKGVGRRCGEKQGVEKGPMSSSAGT
jgi:hypothetical protein